ncbi:glycoside hydrolase family 13 protein [Fervidibacillus halotolerans]|uniref:Alpha-glucosidase n=1 Tax=Fervidibacillus halotolerans TaxID=2980027 RepID=A0A9E8RXW1_9BACI|nr:alpha-glucosidase [Fervidibacillus halotolerans]WAA13170.1 alpha-glucosidase [Fervidibacillus halotolerans]
MNIPWWKKAVFYEIYVPSFCDGNGDGIGDFIGIISKLDYLKELGVDGIWLTPFYRSPKVDNGYDISDYYAIDEDYGTMEDFERFISEAHKRDIKVIADLVLNHTSSEHPWFQEAKSSKDSPKRDWYIWKDPVDGHAPNNWESFFGGSAWEYDEKTGQYYYHAFAKSQVDLNWKNEEVKKAMFSVMDFWLQKGVDGFRLDVINFLKTSDHFPDNPINEKGEQDHVFDKDQVGILETIAEICSFVRKTPGKFLVGEVGSEDLTVLKQYSGGPLLDVVFNFNLGSIKEFDGKRIFSELKRMEEAYTSDQIPTLFFSSHDMSRHISRFSKGKNEVKIAKLISVLMMTAKGIPFIYYGDEIGITDLYFDHVKKMRDVQGLTAYQLAKKVGKGEEEAIRIANEEGRDKSRSPMQWNDSEYAGFSDVEPWLPVSNHSTNVEKQKGDPHSLLSHYQKLIHLRKRFPALHAGQYKLLEEKDNVICYIRERNGEQILIVLNFSAKKVPFPIGKFASNSSTVLVSEIERTIRNGQSIQLEPYESLVIQI